MFFIHTLRKRALSNISAERDVTFMPVQNVHNVEFVFDVGEEQMAEAVQYLVDYLKEKKIDYTGLAINLTKNKNSDFVPDEKTQVITKKDLSFIGTPDTQLIQNFIRQKTDLYIDFCSAHNYTHDFIARSSRATFKVGHFNNNNHPFDLVIGSSKAESSPLDYIKQVIHYLTAIKSA